MSQDSVDRIYEAAAVPELWPDLLHDISVQLGFVGGVVVSSNAMYNRMVASEGLLPSLKRYQEEGWHERNIRAKRTAALRHPGFLRDQDLVSEQELETHPIYVELFRPMGLGYCAGTQVETPNGDTVVFAFERALALGPTPVEAVAALDQLRPHLARATVLSGRLDLERAKAQVSALAGVGLPAAVVGAGRTVLAANEGFEALQDQIEIGARDALTLKDPGAQALLTLALEPSGSGRNGRSIPIKATAGYPPAVLHVLPVRRGAQDVFSFANWLLVVTPLGVGKTPVASILSGLFDLSPAEAKVAKEVVGGRTVSGIASIFGLSEATVRTQLRAVFAKTGASRQAELVALCGSFGGGGNP